MRLKDKVAIVTGGASGFGKAIAELYAKEGAKVMVADLNGQGAREVAEGIGASAAYIACDVSKKADVEAMVSETVKKFGGLDIMVNNAGYTHKNQWMLNVTEEEFDRIFAVNVKAIYLSALFCVPEMEKRGGGVIINTASVAAFEGQIGQAAYSASKGGVVGMTLPIARDLASAQIRVVTIAPGLFETPLLASLGEEVRQSLGKQVPHPSRLGQPAEYAALAAHIIANPMLNGETIRLDGAIRMAPR